MSRSSNTAAAPVSNPASAQGVPDGWKLVPIEPTDRMMLMGGFRFAGKVPNSEVFREVRKGWDDMLSEAPSAPSRDAAVPASGGVKTLKWEGSQHHSRSDVPFEHFYEIRSGWEPSGEHYTLKYSWSNERWNSKHPTFEAAKAAAQADYEQRIRSTLSPAPTSGPEAGGVLLDGGWRTKHDDLLRANGILQMQLRECQDARRTALAKPASGPAGGGVDREAAYKAAWEHADDEIGWEATKSLAAAGNIYMQGQVDWHREMVDKAIAAALSSAPATPSPAESEALPAVVDAYDRGRRDMLNSILALNPAVAAKIAHWEEREPDPLGRLPFNVALWVTEVATQLGIEPKDEALSASAPAPEERA